MSIKEYFNLAGSADGNTDAKRYDQASMSLFFRRNGHWYTKNVVVPLLILSGLALAAFSMENNEVGQKIENITGLILCTITTKFTVAGSLPKVSYLTCLDRFLMHTFVFMAGGGLCCPPPE